MTRQIIHTGDAPASPAYSQAVKAGSTIYVAGTTGVDVATGEFAGPTVKEQARQSLRNCQAILRAAGAELNDAVMVHTLLMRPEDAEFQVGPPVRVSSPNRSAHQHRYGASRSLVAGRDLCRGCQPPIG